MEFDVDAPGPPVVLKWHEATDGKSILADDHEGGSSVIYRIRRETRSRYVLDIKWGESERWVRGYGRRPFASLEEAKHHAHMDAGRNRAEKEQDERYERADLGVFAKKPQQYTVNENPLHFPHLGHLPRLSPKSMQTATSLAVLAGGALLVWWGLKSAAPAGPGHLAAGAPTLSVELFALVIPSTGAYIALPAGAAWAMSVPEPYGGTNTALPVQPSSQPRNFGLDWVDASGVTHTATLIS